MALSHPHEWSKLSTQVVPGVDHLHARFVQRAYEPHAHDDVLVIGLIEGGQQRSSYGRGAYRAGAGSIVVIGPGIAHDGGPADQGGFVYRSLHVDLGVAGDLIDDLADVAAGARGRDLFSLRDPVLPDARAFREMRRFCLAATDPAFGPADRDAALLGAFEALSRVARRGAPEPDTGTGGEPRLVAMARDYIHAHLHEQGLSVSHVAARCRVTRSHLTRAFREAVGLPPHAYLNLQRVQEARRLIARGVAHAHIASITGFVDQSHLIRRFKGVYGVTPGQFQQRA